MSRRCLSPYTGRGQHTNKLKIGHLAGNRFTITVTEIALPPVEAMAQADAIARAIAQRGVPNFFGPQRFGRDGGNVERGREAFLGRGPREKWLNRLLISAFQSFLFNCYLVERMEQGLFGTVLTGDICKKADTGGMFQVEDAAAEQPRFDEGAIAYTGPLFGRKMRPAAADALALEERVLVELGLSEQDVQRSRTDGVRRPARLWLPEINIMNVASGLQLAFSLPKGAYATVVLREFTKIDDDTSLPEESE